MTCVVRTVEVDCGAAAPVQTKGAIGGNGLSVETAVEFLPDELSISQVSSIATKLCEVDAAVATLKACLAPTNKLDATTDPTANDDSVGTAGNGEFEAGSLWLNTSTDELFRCVDASVGAAVWLATSLSAEDLGALATLDTVGLAQVDAPVLARANHTGTQAASTISDFASAVAANATVAANTAARHTHGNAGVLNALTNAGSGAVITTSERATLAALGAYAYDTRANFVSALAAITALASDGDLVFAGTAGYVKVTDSTAISDLAGWEPIGDATPIHWGIAQSTDETTKLTAMCTWAATNNRAVAWPAGHEYHFERLLVGGVGYNIQWWVSGAGRCRLKSIASAPLASSYDADYAVKLKGAGAGTTNLTADMAMGSDVVTVFDTSWFEVGDLLNIRSTRLIATDDRGNAREGQMARVRKIISGTQLAIETQAQQLYKANDIFTGAIATVTSTTQLTLGNHNRAERDMKLLMTMTSGALSGQARYISTWDNATKIATFEQAWPAGLQAGDTYTIQWTTTIGRLSAARVWIGPGLHIFRDETIDATPGDLGFRGLDIEGAIDPYIEDILVEDFSETGIRFRGCYRGKLLQPRVSGANRAYNEWDGTGYGISLNNCWEAHVIGGSTSRCRRGIDVGGAQEVSWFCDVEGMTIHGGGLAYDGEPFWPFGDAQQSGFGSHGSAYHTSYRAMTAINCHGGCLIRGQRERVSNCELLGYGYTPILIRSGGGHTIDGFLYDDKFSEFGRNSTNRYDIPLGVTYRPNFMLEVQTDDISQNLPTTVTNLVARGIVRGMIRFARTDGDIPPFSYGNCRAWPSNEGTGETAFFFLSAENNKVAPALTDMGGNRYFLPSPNTYIDYAMADWSGNIDPAVGTFIEYEGHRSFHVEIPNEGVVVLPIDRSSIIVDIQDVNRDRPWIGIGIALWHERATDQAPVDNRNEIELSTAILTGTTGNPGVLTLSFKPVGGLEGLYIENQQGDVVRLTVHVRMSP